MRLYLGQTKRRKSSDDMLVKGGGGSLSFEFFIAAIIRSLAMDVILVRKRESRENLYLIHVYIKKI